MASKRISDERNINKLLPAGSRINKDYFKTWSRDMSYILGLWFANGYIYGDKIFDITLGVKDKYILKCIAKELKYKGSLYDDVDKQSARLNFSCKAIYDDIVVLGGTEYKALNANFPQIPEDYLSDFIRGYFDGKGNIQNLKDGRLNVTFIGINKAFLDSFLIILRKKVGIKKGSYDTLYNSLKIGNRDSIKIGKYIYQNNPKLFLLRKYKKFKNVI